MNAMLEGREAYRGGMKKSDNPYAKKDSRFFDWELAWIDAMEDARVASQPVPVQPLI